VSRYHSYINTAKEFIELYKGEEPFSSFVKKQFSAQKKFGSRDRKTIAHLCYCYFRLGKSAGRLKIEDRLLTALFLCSSVQQEILQHLKPEWNEKAEMGFDEKLKLVGDSVNYKEVFPLVDELSDGVEAEPFCLSHFIQPDLFLRIRPGRKERVLNKLTKAGVAFELISEDCIALVNTTKIDEMLDVNNEAVVQDYSSQRVGEMLKNLKPEIGITELKVWDCCAASGGKSIMAKDIFGKIDITVSDVRESILLNLKKRFAEAGISNYKSFVADISHSFINKHHSFYDLIIADVPCSGSGTWGRTPEYLSFFNKDKIEEYSALQKRIASNVFDRLQPNGYLLYITCSVFKKENEEVVAFLKEQHQLELVDQQLIKGYAVKADTMFAALLKKIPTA
jgi:16S rRNA (cytosine967-C5)-methyltransferase